MSYLTWETVLPVVAVALYLLYLRKFKFFLLAEKLTPNLKQKLPRGKCPPSYPNGWYRLCRSNELKVG